MYLPGKYALLHSIDAQFVSPVYEGDRLKVQGTIKYINNAYKQIEIKAVVINESFKKVSRAKLKVGLIDG